MNETHFRFTYVLYTLVDLEVKGNSDVAYSFSLVSTLRVLLI